MDSWCAICSTGRQEPSTRDPAPGPPRPRPQPRLDRPPPDRDPLVGVPTRVQDRRRPMTKRPDRLTTTGGSDEREGRSLIAPLMRFRLDDEASRLRAERAYLDGDRKARTLVKAEDFRIVIGAFRRGAEFEETDQRGRIAHQVKEGPLNE